MSCVTAVSNWNVGRSRIMRGGMASGAQHNLPLSHKLKATCLHAKVQRTVPEAIGINVQARNHTTNLQVQARTVAHLNTSLETASRLSLLQNLRGTFRWVCSELAAVEGCRHPSWAQQMQHHTISNLQTRLPRNPKPLQVEGYLWSPCDDFCTSEVVMIQ